MLAAEDALEGLLGYAAVLELAEHELPVASQQRAAGVTGKGQVTTTPTKG